MSRRARQASTTGERQDYLASVSDLMSGLIFIFIITLAVFSLRLALAQESLKKTQQGLEDADDARKGILENLKEVLKEDGIDVEIDSKYEVLRLTDQVVGFESCIAEPRQSDEGNVGKVARALARVLPCHVESADEPLPSLGERPDYCAEVAARPLCDPGHFGAMVETVLVEGHTDSNQIARTQFNQTCKYKDNLELSSARSAAVHRMLAGCEPRLLALTNDARLQVLGVSGYGDKRLLPGIEGTDWRNRRIDIRFIMKPPDRDRQATAAPPAHSLVGDAEREGVR